MKKREYLIIFFLAIILSIFMIFIHKINENKFGNEDIILDKSCESLDSESEEIDKNIDEDSIDYKKIKKDNLESEEIVVYVSGAVKKNGIVKMKSNDRLNDAINKLGGLKSDADLNRINLALILEDEGHYIVPKIGENIESESFKNNKEEDNLISINSDNISELCNIPGVGEKTAEKIIRYRKENGDFSSIEEIKEVDGIGNKKFSNMKNYIKID